MESPWLEFEDKPGNRTVRIECRVSIVDTPWYATSSYTIDLDNMPEEVKQRLYPASRENLRLMELFLRTGVFE